MRLDSKIIADLATAFTPKTYVRVTPMARAATPLGMGYGKTRFASPANAFKVLYIAETLHTAVAEAVVRDRFQDKVGRKLPRSDADYWGVTVVTASRPLLLIDLRTTGLVRLGVSTEAARGKVQTQGRKLSQAVYERTDAEGFVYASRLTAGLCVCVFDRAVNALEATAVSPLVAHADFIPSLAAMNVQLKPTA